MAENQIFIFGAIAGLVVGIIVGSAMAVLFINGSV